MKKLTTILLFIVIACGLKAQGFFNQQGQAIKNLGKQIALLQVYTGYLEKGYDIARAGLGFIGDIKNGDFRLHLDNFNSLKTVKPQIKKYSKAAAIISLRLQITKIYNHIKPIESDYVHIVFANLTGQADNNVSELLDLITSVTLGMKDDERIKRIDALYIDMQDKYAFAMSFSNDVTILSLQQIREKNVVKTSRLLYNINP